MWGKKKDAEHYIKIYCNYSDAEIRNSEIALESPTTFGKLIDHAGEMPNGSGFFHDVLVPKIDRMRTIHPDYPKAFELMRLLNKFQVYCCVSWGYFLDRRPPEAEKTLKTAKDIAEYLKCDYDDYKTILQSGIDRINAELSFLEA